MGCIRTWKQVLLQNPLLQFLEDFGFLCWRQSPFYRFQPNRGKPIAGEDDFLTLFSTLHKLCEMVRSFDDG